MNLHISINPILTASASQLKEPKGSPSGESFGFSVVTGVEGYSEKQTISLFRNPGSEGIPKGWVRRTPVTHSVNRVGIWYTPIMQKIATTVFIYASIAFGCIGIIHVLTIPQGVDDSSVLKAVSNF